MNTGVFMAVVAALLAPGNVWPDEIPMIDGHFVHEKVFTLVLTADQVSALEQRRKAGQRLYRVPLDLKAEQVNAIERQSNKRIKRLWIFEGDWTDCSCQAYDIASRIEKNVVEIPISFLSTEEEMARHRAESGR